MIGQHHAGRSGRSLIQVGVQAGVQVGFQAGFERGEGEREGSIGTPKRRIGGVGAGAGITRDRRLGAPIGLARLLRWALRGEGVGAAE